MRKDKLVIHECYAGKRKSEEVFAAVFLSNAAALTESTKPSIIDDGHFSFTFAGYEYDVSYWSENNGILRYSYNRNATNLRKAIEVVTWLAVGSAFIPVAFASPAFAFALIA